MLFFAIFVGKITLVCILSHIAPPGGKFVRLPSLNESLMASVSTVQNFMLLTKKCTMISQMASATSKSFYIIFVDIFF